jgi:hypothetical protein
MNLFPKHKEEKRVFKENIIKYLWIVLILFLGCAHEPGVVASRSLASLTEASCNVHLQKLKLNPPSKNEILENSHLSDEERFEKAMELLQRKQLSEKEKQILFSALQRAHRVGADNGVFEYSWRELREKYRRLLEGGFSSPEADLLIRTGLAGRPPLRELIHPGDTLFSGFAADIIEKNFHQKRQALVEIFEQQNQGTQNKVFLGIKKILGLKNYSNAQTSLDNFDSIYFIDYNHHVNELEKILVGNIGLSNGTLSSRYNKDAFENFKQTRDYLLRERPPINKETFFKIHQQMMEGGIENLPSNELGKIRSVSVGGTIPLSAPLNESAKKAIDENPFLTWVQKGTAPGGYYGRIIYPNPDDVKQQALDLLRPKYPLVIAEIEEYQNLPQILKDKRLSLYTDGVLSPSQKNEILKEISQLEQRYTDLQLNKEKMTKKLLDAMVDHVMDWFTRERTLIGEINSDIKLDQYVNLLAQFQRDLVSIHPFQNGNGRTTREFALSWALMKEGFPPPRLIDTNLDILGSLEDWQKIIKHGILATDFVMDDMLERLKFGLPVENSLDFITPYTRPPVGMSVKKNDKLLPIEGVEYIDPRFYREMIKREMRNDPTLKNKLETHPLATWDKIHKKVEGVFSRNNLYYHHPKNGLERVAIGYVDEDFKILFGRATYHDKKLFEFKMKTWYSEEINWRCLSHKQLEKSEEEIIEMFKQLSTHNASNAILTKVRSNPSAENIRIAVLEDFEQFNNDVFGTGLVKMAKDHSETGPMYSISYGYSTSKSRDVGKAFAMGAMVVADYGAHKTPELQSLLKSRILVGSRRAHKDVDLGRLKQLREEFSYKYGRQQEVMGIGATDPDAVTIIQTIDAQGEVILSYLRNKNNPREILVIRGGADPDSDPRSLDVLRTITLP